MTSLESNDEYQVLLTSLLNTKREISSSSNVDQVVENLKSLINLIFSKYSEKKDSISPSFLFEGANWIFFQSGLYGSFIEFLIVDVASNWLSCMNGEQRVIFETLFVSAPSFAVLDGIYRSTGQLKTLSNNHQLASAPHLLSLLESFTSNQRFYSLFCEIESNEETQSSLWNNSLQCLTSLPDKLSNLFAQTKGMSLPSVYLPKSFFSIVLRQLLNFFTDRLESKEAIKIVTDVIEKVSRLGYGDVVAEEMLSFLQQNMKIVAGLEKVLMRMGDLHSLERIIEPLVKRVSDQFHGVELSSLFFSLFGNVLLLNASTKQSQFYCYLFTTKFIVGRVYGETMLKSLITFLLPCSNDCSPQENRWKLKALIGMPMVCRVAKTWSDQLFVRHAEMQQQKYVTQAILLSLNRLQREDLEEFSDITSCLINGVQLWFQSNVSSSLQMGMQVAEELSITIDPSKPLKFPKDNNNNNNNNHSYDDIQPATTTTTSTEDRESSQIYDNTNNKARTKKKQVKGDDPDELIFDDSEEEQDHDTHEVESDEDLPAYDLQDDEADLDPFKKPIYLRDCIAALESAAADTFDSSHLQSVLYETEVVIRSKAPLEEIEYVHRTLIDRLLYLPIKEDVDVGALHHLQCKAVTAIVTQTDLAVDYLCSRFYDNNFNLHQRLMMLQILADSAKELSSLSVPLLAKTNEPIIERVGTVSRRSASSSSAPRTTTRNQFRLRAGRYFYGLANRYDLNSREYFQLLSEDATLLDKFICTLSIFVECLGSVYSEETITICRSLFALIWTLRYTVETVPVKRASLLALKAIFVSTLSMEEITAQFEKEFSEAMIWLQGTIEDEGDSNCRDIAQFILVHLAKKMKEYDKSSQ